MKGLLGNNWLAGIGQQNAAQQSYSNSNQGLGAQAQNVAQQNAAGLQQQYGAQFQPNWNDHVPVWDEGGYEPWLGKPPHRFEYCQRCMFL